MSDITRKALESYRKGLVLEFSANIAAIDAALGNLAPAEQSLPYENAYVAAPPAAAEPEPVLVQQTYADGGYVTPAEPPAMIPATPAEPALVKTDSPPEPWAVPTEAPAAEKKGRRTNEEIAASYGVDLKDVVGTGKNGRVTHDDIKAAGEAKATAAAAPAQVSAPQEAPVADPPTPDQFAAFQAQQQAQQQLAWPQPEQPQAPQQFQQPTPEQFAKAQAQQAQQFVPPQAQQAPQFQQQAPQAPQNFTPPPALPEGFAPQAFQQAY